MDGCEELLHRLRVVPLRRIPVQYKREVHPLIAKEHASGKGPDMKAGSVHISALSVGTYPQWNRDEIDEVAQRKNAAELLQRLAMLKEITLQRLRIVPDQFLCRGRKRFHIVQKRIRDPSLVEKLKQPAVPSDRLVILRSER